MARKRSLNPSKRGTDRKLTLVGTTKAINPTPRRFELGTLRGIRREMGQVYKLARTGELALADACKYGFLLSTLAKLSESELLEDRLARLESTLEARSQTLSLESRIEKLEAKLVPSDPQERKVAYIVLVNPDGTTDPVAGYSDGCGHKLQREPGESPETFQSRAEAWVRFEHRHDAPLGICVLSPACHQAAFTRTRGP